MEEISEAVNSDAFQQAVNSDIFSRTINAVTDSVLNLTDAISPKKILVPHIITIGANVLREASTSTLSPYRLRHINLNDIVFWQAAIVILLHPVIWNIIGRFEHYTRILSRVFIKPRYGVYALAVWIFFAGLYRDALFNLAIERQDKVDALGSLPFRASAVLLIVVGVIFVLSAFYQLGICGTYLGDYFGILMDQKVTAFPFNIRSNPMYDGSTLIFLGKAIL